MGSEAEIRVGTSDRERAVEALAEHLAGGRLEISEYEQRCAAATAARVRADLRALFVDLPRPHPTFDPAPTPAPAPVPVPRGVAQPQPEQANGLWEPHRTHRNNRGLFAFLGVAGVSTVAVVAFTGTWWALAPLGILALILVFTS
ncbi:DUF1707 domain-containing protein [Actinokineospora auranticolor]|uniref:Uncharacterized protein DUF1707 n=1 Tax=Actinokineospora auranticolor TaxID=155976 RepID=A0A2S6GFP8_9PSEU|nr:DUF1707 domain-containing protein [Actinokineospora auranticolor]PPK64048.1 uncharacterized protein DUF1707 [Actinokineospora auranticolor]